MSHGLLGQALLLAGLCACATAPTLTPVCVQAVVEVPAAPDAGCGPDIATRRPGAEAVEAFDLDADGDLDLVFRDGYDLHGNADFLFYRVDGTCATSLGEVTSFVVNTPYCVAPPVPGTPCRLSASRRMYHDDYQELFYEVVDGGFVEVGQGRYQASPRSTKQR